MSSLQACRSKKRRSYWSPGRESSCRSLSERCCLWQRDRVSPWSREHVASLTLLSLTLICQCLPLVGPIGGQEATQPIDTFHTHQPLEHKAGKRSIKSEIALEEQVKYIQLTGQTQLWPTLTYLDHLTFIGLDSIVPSFECYNYFLLDKCFFYSHVFSSFCCVYWMISATFFPTPSHLFLELQLKFPFQSRKAIF